jgi:hypothetical protein
MDELSEEDKMTVARARKIQRFLSQPFTVAEVFTGTPGACAPVLQARAATLRCAPGSSTFAAPSGQSCPSHLSPRPPSVPPTPPAWAGLPAPPSTHDPPFIGCTAFQCLRRLVMPAPPSNACTAHAPRRRQVRGAEGHHRRVQGRAGGQVRRPARDGLLHGEHAAAPAAPPALLWRRRQ